jgi:hypothetical protein
MFHDYKKAMRQLVGMGFDPIHDCDIINCKMAGDLTKACPIGIHFDGLTPQRIAIHLAWLRRIATIAALAAPTLTPHACFSGFDLLVCVVTVWTCAHPINYPTSISFTTP